MLNRDTYSCSVHFQKNGHLQTEKKEKFSQNPTPHFKLEKPFCIKTKNNDEKKRKLTSIYTFQT